MSKNSKLIQWEDREREKLNRDNWHFLHNQMLIRTEIAISDLVEYLSEED